MLVAPAAAGGSGAAQSDPAPAVASTRRRGAAAVIVLAVLLGGASVAVISQGSRRRLTFASTSPTVAVIDVATGLVLVLAGAAWWVNSGKRAIDVLAALVGVTWLATDWVAWSGGPALVRSAAMVVAPFLLPVVIHLSFAFDADRGAKHRTSRVVIAGTYAVAAVVSVGWALLRDPFLDRSCTANCTVNSLLVHSAPSISRLLSSAWLRVSVVEGLALAGMCSWRISRASRVARRSVLPVLAAAAAIGVVHALYAAALILDPVENPERPGLRSLYVARAVAFDCLAGGLICTMLHELRVRRSLRQLADAFAGASVPPLAEVLTRSLGDQSLDVFYWLPESQTYVDAHGHRVDPRHRDSQSTTTIQRNGEPIALVLHDLALAGRPHLERDIGAAARLAVDNERLRAQTLAQIAELSASRRRIVAAADSTRRQLEHNLHDGAQQRLLALSYEIRLAESEARACADGRLVQLLGAAAKTATDALAELRDLAHGIFPMILVEAGLAPALESVADTAPLAVRLIDVPQERYPDEIEIALYLLITETIADAARRQASTITISCITTPSDVTIQLADDAASIRYSPPTHIADRIGAIGGQILYDDAVITAVLPCA